MGRKLGVWCWHLEARIERQLCLRIIAFLMIDGQRGPPRILNVPREASFSKELIILHFSLVRSWFLSQKSVLQFADFNFHFFQDVLKSTRAQLEKEFLMDDVVQIEDMPSYSLLC